MTQCNWSGLKNGQLLTKAQDQFDIFLTVDRKLPLQQNINKLSIGIVVILSASNVLEQLRPIVPELLQTLAHGPFHGVRYIGT